MGEKDGDATTQRKNSDLGRGHTDCYSRSYNAFFFWVCRQQQSLEKAGSKPDQLTAHSIFFYVDILLKRSNDKLKKTLRVEYPPLSPISASLLLSQVKHDGDCQKFFII